MIASDFAAPNPPVPPQLHVSFCPKAVASSEQRVHPTMFASVFGWEENGGRGVRYLAYWCIRIPARTSVGEVIMQKALLVEAQVLPAAKVP